LPGNSTHLFSGANAADGFAALAQEHTSNDGKISSKACSGRAGRPGRRDRHGYRLRTEKLWFARNSTTSLDIRLPLLRQAALALPPLNLALPARKALAIMGPSGAGKSTLAKLLQGFVLPQEGRILIDGSDLGHLSANELRGHFDVVPQETILFSGTLYDNLLAANPHAGFDDVVTACRMAEIHDFIEGLPGGYQTEVGERGVGLSGGQRQRIAIARALLKRPRVLIFDEATSALDPATAEHLAKTINSLKGAVTMLFIAHQLPKALNIDGVVKIAPRPTVVTEEGRVNDAE
jgi:ABC-type bacteriocin/lantibiotic exporter with double-glycine peptidase domain